jgi:hypothetical protein
LTFAPFGIDWLDSFQKGDQMLRWPAALLTVTTTAFFLGLLEPALAASDTVRMLLILSVLILFRSPVWLTSWLSNGRAGVA